MEFITYKGVSSLDLGLYLLNEVTHEIAGQDIESVVVQGRDGELLISNDRLNVVTKSFPFRLKTENMQKSLNDLSYWLQSDGWHDLTLSWDPDYIYKATHYTQVEVSETVRTLGKVLLSFKVHPIKYSREGRKIVDLNNGMTLHNPYNLEAKPVITIYGNGNCEIIINGRVTRIESLQGKLTLDMHNNLVHDDGLARWNKVLRGPKYAMPYLDPGDNVIQIKGNITGGIMPNWGVKV